MKHFVQNETALVFLRVIYIFTALCFTSLTVFAIYNMKKYVIRMKVKWMIRAFYVLAILTLVFHSVYFTTLAVQPWRSPFYHREDASEDGYFKYMDLLELCGSGCWRLLSWLVLVITFQLSMTLRVILNEKTPEEANKQIKILIFVASIFYLTGVVYQVVYIFV